MYHTLFYVFVASLCFSLVGAMQTQHSSRLDAALRCPDGRPGLVTQLQAESLTPFQPAIYVTDCSPSKNETEAPKYQGRPGTAAVSALSRRRLEERGINMCGSGCLNTCSWSSSGPASSDCSGLSNYIASRGSSYTVSGWQKITATSGTCMTTFTNLNFLSVTWCDSTWASQAGGLAGQCSTGGTCFGTLFTVTTETNPDYTPPVNTPTTAAATTPADPPTTANNPGTANQGGNTPTTSSSANNGNNNGATTAVIHSSSNSNGNLAVSSLSGSNVNSANTGGTADDVHFYTSSIPVTTLSNGSIMPLGTTLTFGAYQTTSCSESSCTGIPTGNTTTTKPPSSVSDSPGVIIAIILGIIVLMAIFIALMCWRRRRNRVGQTILVGPFEDEEKERPEVEVISEPRSPSDRAYTIMSAQSTGFGRALEQSAAGSSPHSPHSPHSPASHNSVMSTGMGESRISYVPFWDLITADRKGGTVSDLGLDIHDSSSESSCYSNDQQKLGRPLSTIENGGDARMSAYNPEGQIRRLVVNPDPVQSLKASSDEGHRAKSDTEDASHTPVTYPSIDASPATMAGDAAKTMTA